jgi:iron complex transport system substrate-binding protein
MSSRSALLLAISVTAACGEAGSPPAAGSFRDPEGRELVIDSLPVDRIVSTLQSATEWLVLLGAADLLVARTDFDRQPELADLPSIGGGLDPSAEVVAALKPDVVLGWRIRSSVDLQRALDPFDIPVIDVEATDTTEVFRQLVTLGRLTGRSIRADSLAENLRTKLAKARAGCPQGALPTVMIVLWSQPPMTSGRSTWMSELLGAACLENAFADLASAWPPVSLEAIAVRNPDWLLTAGDSMPGRRLAEFRELPGWRELPAVIAGQVIEIPGDLFARAGPFMADWVAAVIAGRAAAAAAR